MMIGNVKKWIKSQIPFTQDLTKKLTAKKWPEKSIVYYLGKRFLVLESDIKTKGASGSDSAVFFLTREWVKQGYDVTVFTNCEDKEGIYGGVKYVNYEKINWYDTFETFIMWRHPKMLPSYVKAKRIWFDWHDVITFDDRIYLNPYQKIFVKSYYQRNLLPELPDNKFAIINNGADSSVLELAKNQKQPYKLVYASRYYRGLEFMLTWGWPIIKREIPEAELNIYYGWTKRDSSEKIIPWKQKMMELMQQEGVVEHGSIGHNQLMYEKSTSVIHYYGCSYGEIDCISLRESAMVGCVPVTTNYAAIKEKDYCIKVDGDPKTKETQEALAYRIVELLNNPQELENIREEIQEKVKNETWEQVAPFWLKNIDS
ncbi:glycosyltransferase family 1 protein [Dapis sp. BLCC M172]|uniref:glycosyltransferase family 1 protein n=1 Tax=Dapis sp. BLCC M172 TaxID=2975281 RepID=UPI003CECDFE2